MDTGCLHQIPLPPAAGIRVKTGTQSPLGHGQVEIELLVSMKVSVVLAAGRAASSHSSVLLPETLVVVICMVQPVSPKARSACKMAQWVTKLATRPGNLSCPLTSTCMHNMLAHAHVCVPTHTHLL